MKFAKTVFLIAGIYGLIVLVPQFFLERKIGEDTPPPITHPEFFYGFICVAVAWQVLFLILSRDPIRYRPMMIPAMLEKIGFPVAVLLLYLQGLRVETLVSSCRGVRLVVAIDPRDFRAGLHGQRSGFKCEILNDDLILFRGCRLCAGTSTECESQGEQSQ